MEFRRVLFRSRAGSAPRLGNKFLAQERQLDGQKTVRDLEQVNADVERSEERRVGKECRSLCDGVQTCALPISCWECSTSRQQILSSRTSAGRPKDCT